MSPIPHRSVRGPGRGTRDQDARMGRNALAILVALVLGWPCPARPDVVVIDEGFASRSFADTALTTAHWDTVAGTLHLHPRGVTDVGSLAVAGVARAVAWRDGHVLVANGSGNALAVVDVTDPAAPTLVRSHALPAESRHVVVAGGWAYVALGSGFGVQAIDVTDVANPANAARTDLTGFTAQCAVAGEWLYAALSASGIGVLDRSDPSTPVAGPAVELGTWVRAVAVDGGHLFTADDDRLTVLDLADPAAPTVVTAVAVSGTGQSVAVSDGLVCIGGGFGVDILDISNPAAPQPLATVDLGGGTAFGVAVAGDSLYVANGNAGLHVVDITDPAAPVVVGQRQSTSYFYDCLPRDDLIHAAHGDAGLLVVAADAQGLDPVRNRAVSRGLNPGGEPVASVRLQAAYTDSIRFEISGDGGNSWRDLPPDRTLLTFEPQAADLRWRATLVQTGPWPGPVCDALSLEIERLHGHAEITSVADVPGDAGGQVRVAWRASRYDAPGLEYLVTDYSVYRRYRQAVAGAPVPAYPPGDWEYVLSVPADREDVYAVTVPTLADSSAAGPAWAVFFVRARTSVAGTFFDSPPDSGYSRDDSAPAAPSQFTITRLADRVELNWDPSADPDFAHFRLYRDPSPLMAPSPTTLYAVTTGTTWTDPTAQLWYYHLTQVNSAGVESPPAVRPTAVPVGAPAAGFRGRITPNPGNPAFRIDFVVSGAGHHVRLDVLDTRGRLVTTLADGWRSGGEHALVWRGRDRHGRTVASGVYTCRLQCGSGVQTRKLTLLR